MVIRVNQVTQALVDSVEKVDIQERVATQAHLVSAVKVDIQANLDIQANQVTQVFLDLAVKADILELVAIQETAAIREYLVTVENQVTRVKADIQA